MLTIIEQIQAAQDSVNGVCNAAKATIQASQDASNTQFEILKSQMSAVGKDFPASIGSPAPAAPSAQ